jgi:hypothetical protein
MQTSGTVAMRSSLMGDAMTAYTRDAMIAFVVALAVTAIVISLMFFGFRENGRNKHVRVEKIRACRTIESEPLRTLCIKGE